MKVKKSLFLSLCSLVLMMQFSYVAGEKTKDGYEIIPLEEFNNLYPNEVPRKIIIPNYYGGGIKYTGAHEIINNVDYSKVEKKYPNLYERIIHYAWEKEVVTCTIKGKIKYDNSFGGRWSICVTEIENLRSLEEVESKKQAMLQRIDKVKDLAPKKIEEIKNSFDQQGASIAKGYTYHGTNESERNLKLLKNKALEKQHAYYIPNFNISGSLAEVDGEFDLRTWKIKKELVVVDYLSQTLKVDIVDSGKTDVIIAGGRIIPTVIGSFGERLEKQKNYYDKVNYFDINDGRFDLAGLEQYEKDLGIVQE